tara:strand:- start:3161 stop:3475 length:315 start_codon:yes stop_codon:yes gene_type:complete
MTRIRFKRGVKIRGLKPEMAAAIPIIASTYFRLGYTDCVFTSGVDGDHMEGSKHYEGGALDLRIWEVPHDDLSHLKAAIAGALTDEFDVVGEETHIHIEFDAKD